MGNDGGSIPHRAEMVKTKKKEEHKDNFEIARAKSRLCSMSKEPLRKPIAVCRLGLLYNKEEVVKRLIEKSIPRAFRHIKKLKDIKEANIQIRPNPQEEGTNIIICPVSQLEFNGFQPFVMIWTCGCVLSEEAVQELKMEDKCLNCGIKFDRKENDIISLNQSPDQQLQYLRQFDEQQKLADEKVAKKKKDKQSKINGKRKDREDDNIVAEDDREEIKEGDKKRIKTKDTAESKNLGEEIKSDAYKSLFTKQYQENKDTDFLCRCVHRGLR